MTLRQVLNAVVGVFLLACVMLASLLFAFTLMNQASTVKFLAGVVVIGFTLWLVPQIAARMFRRTNGNGKKLAGTVDSDHPVAGSGV